MSTLKKNHKLNRPCCLILFFLKKGRSRGGERGRRAVEREGKTLKFLYQIKCYFLTLFESDILVFQELIHFHLSDYQLMC